MAKNIVISEAVVRARVTRIRSGKPSESQSRGFAKYPKPQKRLCGGILRKKGAGNG